MNPRTAAELGRLRALVEDLDAEVADYPNLIAAAVAERDERIVELEARVVELEAGYRPDIARRKAHRQGDTQ